mgnify:CR=1 FL=1
MPFYTQICETCGVVEDAWRKVSEYKICEKCGGACEVKLAATPTLGIVWSNQESSAQLGTHWETNAQKRDWFKSHPGVMEMSKGDANDRKLEDTIKNSANDTLKKKGYTDLNHFRSHRKKVKENA